MLENQSQLQDIISGKSDEQSDDDGGEEEYDEFGEDLNIGEMVVLSRDRDGVIQFIGKVEFAKGTWYGIELTGGYKRKKKRMFCGVDRTVHSASIPSPFPLPSTHPRSTPTSPTKFLRP